MKLWEKSTQVADEIDRFTVGHDRELDLYLAKYDVMGSMAHIRMLNSIGLLGDDELPQLLQELRAIYDLAARGEFVIEDGIEDVHSQVELMLTRRLGDMGKKIHAGRSRNDQVLVDLKLFTRDKLRQVAEAVRALFDKLQIQSERYKNILSRGDHVELIQMIKAIYAHQKQREAEGKRLHMCDEYFFRDAEQLLYTEFRYVLGFGSKEELRGYIFDRIENK